MKNKRTPLEIFMKTTFFALFTMLLCSLGAAEPAPKGSPYGPTVEIPDGYRCEFVHFVDHVRIRRRFAEARAFDRFRMTVAESDVGDSAVPGVKQSGVAPGRFIVGISPAMRRLAR